MITMNDFTDLTPLQRASVLVAQLRTCLEDEARDRAAVRYEEVADWDAPRCLRWLAAHTTEPNHFADRAGDWGNEVARFAAYEGVDPDAWNDEATEELRWAVVVARGGVQL